MTLLNLTLPSSFPCSTSCSPGQWIIHLKFGHLAHLPPKILEASASIRLPKSDPVYQNTRLSRHKKLAHTILNTVIIVQ